MKNPASNAITEQLIKSRHVYAQRIIYAQGCLDALEKLSQEIDTALDEKKDIDVSSVCDIIAKMRCDIEKGIHTFKQQASQLANVHKVVEKFSAKPMQKKG